MSTAEGLDVRGLLLDIDGVLTVSWEPIPGSVEAFATIRDRGVPLALLTNTTTFPRPELADLLRSAGFEHVQPNEIVTAVVATAAFLREHHPGARVRVLSDGDARADMEDIELVGPGEAADVVVIGGASDRFSYEALNEVFGLVMGGAELVGMHRNRYWRTDRGLQLDSGAYLAGLEEVTGARAVTCGKPSEACFHAGLGVIGVPASEALMVGDDIVSDVGGAQLAGIRAALVRTGKFTPTDLDRGTPDLEVADLAALAELLGDRPS